VCIEEKANSRLKIMKFLNEVVFITKGLFKKNKKCLTYFLNTNFVIQCIVGKITATPSTTNITTTQSLEEGICNIFELAGFLG